MTDQPSPVLPRPLVVDSRRILIVEDEGIVALNLEHKLEKLGYEVVGRAASSTEAIRLAHLMKPDLVLMDIHIDGPVDGIDTATVLAQELKLRVVYLTAYSEDATLARARATRPYGYLLKPFSDRELHATLQMALERRAADLALAEKEEMTRLAMESAAMGSWEFIAAGAELRTYGLATELLGADGEPGSITLDTLLACAHPEDRAQTRLAVESAARGEAACSVEFRQLRADGRLRWIRIVARVFCPTPTATPRLVGIAQEVTDRHATESRLRLAAALFDEAREGLFILDGEHHLVAANPAFALMTGLDSVKWKGRALPFLNTPMLSGEAQADLWGMLVDRDSWVGDVRVERPGGELFPGRLSLSVAGAGTDDEVQIVGILSDVSELRAAQEALRSLAHYDPLTQLPNRLLLQDRLQHALDQSRRSNTRVAVLFLDLDQFKRINDTRGHAIGDLVLREVAGRIRSEVRTCDTAARLGGDEFVVVLEGIRDTSQLITVAEKLRASLIPPVVVAGHRFHTSASIGIAVSPEDGMTVDQLLQNADTAMYEAKAGGRNNIRFYDQGMTVRVAQYLARDSRLHQALGNGEFTLHYQPQIDALSGRCIAVEALIRWRHPELGLLGAVEIIPAAEESGLIVDIGRWALHEACRQAQAWRMEHGLDLRMAVNVSAVQMERGKLADDIEAALGASGLASRHLEIEITESSLQTETVAVSTLHRVRELGVSVAIDDFGTGYSCLSSLKHLPLDRLKIDRSFVRELPDDAHSAALAETILAIASLMKVKVTAEGVETPQQLAFLSQRGCREVQGWLYSPAVEGARIPDLVQCLGGLPS